jgi:flavin reductase (DIM6/NTAB) family NADH-FMN oxidoreductase RutF
LFYETAKRDHGLPHDPFKAIVAPRPVGWISSISAKGKVNLAPYSYFNAISSRPDLVMFSSEGVKDSVTNIRQTGEFVANHAGFHLAEKMNLTSVAAPHGTNEFEIAGLTQAPSRLVTPPRVAEAYAALECRLVQEVVLRDIAGRSAGAIMIIGEVVGVHIDEAVVRDGRFDVSLARPVARLGYRDFGGPEGYFEMVRPDWEDFAEENLTKA